MREEVLAGEVAPGEEAVEVGLRPTRLSEFVGQVEVKEGLNEGDIVVARAGALLREGDAVRTIMAEEGSKK